MFSWAEVFLHCARSDRFLLTYLENFGQTVQLFQEKELGKKRKKKKNTLCFILISSDLIFELLCSLLASLLGGLFCSFFFVERAGKRCEIESEKNLKPNFLLPVLGLISGAAGLSPCLIHFGD